MIVLASFWISAAWFLFQKLFERVRLRKGSSRCVQKIYVRENQDVSVLFVFSKICEKVLQESFVDHLEK